MKKTSILVFALSLFSINITYSQEKHSETVRKIYDEALVNGKAYENLEYLCKRIGNRLSGSPQAEAAVQWTKQLMSEFDTVYLQPVKVPKWSRGKVEVAKIKGMKKADIQLNVLSLGNSQGTGRKGVEAEVIEVNGIDELKALGKNKVENKIIFFNRPMNPSLIDAGEAYGDAVDQRSRGAAAAAELGARAVIVRSMTLAHDDVPHTGITRYDKGGSRIPAMAVSTKDANLLSKMLKEKNDLKLYMENDCEMLDSIISYNVIGEIKGSVKPEEYITVGGHLDSWDVGEGAHDDGSGCVQSLEVLRIFKTLGIQPKRTIRAVMFMNEENGVMGGKEYARVAKEKGEIHKVAIESDAGGFTPLGFNMEGDQKQVALMQQFKSYFEPYQLFNFREGHTGTDIEPLRGTGVLLLGLYPDSQRYFNIHHTKEDTFEKVDKRELELGAAAMASIIYLLDSVEDL